MASIESFSQQKPKIKNVVIVHGAFADASGWEAVYKILKQDRYNACAILTTDDKSIHSELERTMYKRAGSHTLYMSQPKAVAAVLNGLRFNQTDKL